MWGPRKSELVSVGSTEIQVSVWGPRKSELVSVGSTEIRVSECGVHGNSELASGVRSKDEEGGVE